MKNFVLETVKSWNRFSDWVPRKRAGARSSGDKSRYGLLVVKSVGVSMQAVCVALQSVAVQDARVFQVCESCTCCDTWDGESRCPKACNCKARRNKRNVHTYSDATSRVLTHCICVERQKTAHTLARAATLSGNS